MTFRLVHARAAVGACGALVVLAALTACGGDDDAAGVASTTTPAATIAAPTTSPAISGTPATTAAPAPSASAAPTVTGGAEGDGGDENGEFEGQLILDYPGTPLRRTTSTAPNDDVEALQIRLNEVGYRVDTDGRFDADTETVVIAFQRDNGLRADGIVGEATWAALFTFEG